MKITNEPEFYSLEQLDLLIDLPITEIESLLTPSVNFKGLLIDKEQQLFYADGSFMINESKLVERCPTNVELEMMENGMEPDIETWNELVLVTGIEASQNKKLIGNKYPVKSRFQIKEIIYNYDEFIEIITRLGVPLTSTKDEISKKKFNYDIQKTNKKSNFTVYEASLIASNLYSLNHTKLERAKHTIPLQHDEYQLQKYNCDILCECIKGQNQQGFHLITKELWCIQYCLDEDEHSNRYDNGTRLKASSEIDVQLTILSKNELLRWCEFMDIETGLTIDAQVENESVEFLKLEIERLNKRVIELIPPPSKYRPCPPAPPVKLKSKVEINYPPELQLTIDAYDEFCSLKENRPTNSIIQNWLKQMSEDRKIKHNDGARELKGLSQKKLEVITSIIKS